MTSPRWPVSVERTGTLIARDGFAQFRRTVTPILALWTLAVSLPLFEVLGHNPTFLVAHNLAGYRLFIFGLLILIGMPLLLGLVGYAAQQASTVTARLFLFLVYTALLCAISALIFDGMYSPLGSVIVLATSGVLARIILFPTVQSFANIFGIILPVLALILFLTILPSSHLFLPSSGEYSGPTRTSNNPAFVVIFDELPLTTLLNQDLEIDSQLFPNFHKLSQRSTWFTSARTVSVSTDRAIPALLTGVPPAEDDTTLPIATNHPENLFGLMSDRNIVAIEPISQLCQYNNCDKSAAVLTDNGSWSTIATDTAIVALHQFVPVQYRGRLPSIDQGWADFGNEPSAPAPSREDSPSESRQKHRDRVQEAVWSDATAAVNEYISHIQDVDSKSTVFGHFMLPHAPWTYLPTGQIYQRERTGELGKGPNGTWGNNQWLIDHAYRRHILQTQFADFVLGDIIRAIEEAELWEEAAFVVASDHGIGFESSLPRRGKHPATEAEVYPVPLFIKMPNQRGFANSAYPAFISDIAPTMAEAIGVAPAPAYPRATVLDPNSLEESGLVRDLRPFSHIPEVSQSELQAAAQEKYELFGDGSGQLDPFAIGDYGSLIGRQVQSLNLGAPVSEARLSIVSGAKRSLQSAGSSDPYLPILMEGALSGDFASEGLEFLISLNGRVAGMARSFQGPNGPHFQTLLDPQHLHDGSANGNHIEAYLVEGSSGDDVQFRGVEIQEEAQ